MVVAWVTAVAGGVGEATGFEKQGSDPRCSVVDCRRGSSERGMQTGWTVLLVSGMGSPGGGWTPRGHRASFVADIREGFAALYDEQ